MNLVNNPSFEDGWETIQLGAEYGYLKNQRPLGWRLRWLEPGESLFGVDAAHGVPECVHKLAHQLPPNEQIDGVDPLVLDGKSVFKVFHAGAAFGAELWQVVEGLEPGTVITLAIPVRIHNHAQSGDHFAAESGAWLLTEWEEHENQCLPIRIDDQVGEWVPIGKAGDRIWHTHHLTSIVPASGRVCVLLRFKSKWNHPIDFFIDAIQMSADEGQYHPPGEPGDLDLRVRRLENAIVSLAQEITG